MACHVTTTPSLAKSKRPLLYNNIPSAMSPTPQRVLLKLHRKPRPEQYSCITPLATGSYGQIFSAIDAPSKKQVVIKKIPKGVEQKRVDNEIKALERLPQRKNLIQYHGSFETRNHRCLVFEHIKGGDLFNLMEFNNFQPLPEDIVKNIGYQIASCLHHCHQHGVAHRDIKLENIMVDEQLRTATLIDFGLCTFFPVNGSEDISSDYCGSLEYTSPEVIQQTPFSPTKADVWSLGVTLYALLFGQFPFNVHECVTSGQNAFVRPVTFPQNDFRKNVNVSAEARKLLEDMLNIMPQERITMGETVGNSWFSTISSQNAGC